MVKSWPIAAASLRSWWFEVIRFLALHWDERGRDSAERLTAAINQDLRDWRLLARRADFSLWVGGAPVADANAASQPPGDGWLIGRAFRRGNPAAAVLTTGPMPIDLDLRSDTWPERWCRDWWGDYIAFAHDSAGLTVLRDPVGALPCWYFDLVGARCWFADLGDVQRLLKPKLTLNRAGLAAHLQIPKLGKAGTCLNEVATVLPAEVLVAAADRTVSRRFAWDPATFCDVPVGSIEDATTTVRSAVEETLIAYTRYFRAPAISVGGLDSSIIWSLADALEIDHVQGFTLYSESALGDERDYVRQLAAQDRLHALPMDGAAIDSERVFKPLAMVNPPGFSDLIELSWNRTEHPALSRADALIYGVGGDNVFLQGADIFGAIDHGQSRSPLRSMAGAVSDAARYSKRWWPGVLAATLRARFIGGRPASAAAAGLLQGDPLGLIQLPRLRPEAVAEQLHPLLRPFLARPPGKALQVLSSCFCASDYLDPCDGEDQIERCEFFLSQPIVEACLQIPAWQLAHRGVERGLARLCFADVLPDPVLRRMTKGTPETIYQDFVRLNQSAIRQFLSDGALVSLGLADSLELAVLLDPDQGLDAEFRAHPIVQLIGTEAWLRQWV